mmetsp:Transcript_43499/g.49344  ORF Transcript_43499/g.49344 Transcript_43499/m.49344 type:complete len:249 (-) Transcript_43499:1245-1991(-)
MIFFNSFTSTDVDKEDFIVSTCFPSDIACSFPVVVLPSFSMLLVIGSMFSSLIIVFVSGFANNCCFDVVSFEVFSSILNSQVSFLVECITDSLKGIDASSVWLSSLDDVDSCFNDIFPVMFGVTSLTLDSPPIFFDGSPSDFFNESNLCFLLPVVGCTVNDVFSKLFDTTSPIPESQVSFFVDFPSDTFNNTEVSIAILFCFDITFSVLLSFTFDLDSHTTSLFSRADSCFDGASSPFLNTACLSFDS